MSTLEEQIEDIHRNFSRIYLGGIPAIITDESAFLSFICVLAATEALAGYRYSDVRELGKRFKKFVKEYFPKSYKEHASDLWDLRNGLFHAFAPRKFALSHHRSYAHLKKQGNGNHILNAEDFYAALLSASQRYFSELRSDSDLQKLFNKRLNDDQGGAIGLGPISKIAAAKDA